MRAMPLCVRLDLTVEVHPAAQRHSTLLWVGTVAEESRSKQVHLLCDLDGIFEVGGDFLGERDD